MSSMPLGWEPCNYGDENFSRPTTATAVDTWEKNPDMDKEWEASFKSRMLERERKWKQHLELLGLAAQVARVKDLKERQDMLEKSGLLNKTRTLSPLALYQYDAPEDRRQTENGQRAVRAARKCSDYGRRFDDSVLWRKETAEDGPVWLMYHPVGPTEASRCMPGRQIPAIIEVTTRHPVLDAVFGAFDDSIKPSSHAISVSFDLNIHRPLITVHINLTSKQKVAVHFFSTHLISKTEHAPIKVSTPNDPHLRSSIEQDTKLGKVPSLLAALKEGRVSQIRLRLNKSTCIRFTGDASRDDIALWRGSLWDGGQITPQQHLLASLASRPEELVIHFAARTGKKNKKRDVKEQIRMGPILTAAMWLGAELGDGWWFREENKTD